MKRFILTYPILRVSFVACNNPQERGAANVSRAVHAAILKMWEESDPSVKDFFQFAAEHREKCESSKPSEESRQKVTVTSQAPSS